MNIDLYKAPPMTQAEMLVIRQMTDKLAGIRQELETAALAYARATHGVEIKTDPATGKVEIIFCTAPELVAERHTALLNAAEQLLRALNMPAAFEEKGIYGRQA